MGSISDIPDAKRAPKTLEEGKQRKEARVRRDKTGLREESARKKK